MTIDLHKVIGKLPIIPKKGLVLPNMHYCGPYNPLNKQLIYDKNGNILIYMQKTTGKTDEICAQHDIDYTVVSHIYTYDRAQNILNFVRPLQNLILYGNL